MIKTPTITSGKKPVDQWVALNHLLKGYKLGALGLIGLSVILSITCFLSLFRDPIVVVMEESKKTYAIGIEKQLPLDESDVIAIVEQFIYLRYQWQDLLPNQISRNLSPLVSKGLGKKIFSALNDAKTNQFKDKKVKQTVINLQIVVGKEKVTASFDRLLKIDGIPLPIASQIAVHLSKGEKTIWNPRGLYINGVIEYEGS